ncbi:MAG: cysteine desulfurase NifS [Dehalococcoidia bacterium]|nr:cysteine desulfurase NifS [Dehalococcoidia bacterium]
MKRIYLDYAATTPAHPEVVKAMQSYYSNAFGNSSSIHSYGQETREAIEIARKKVAALINARSEEIIFTSGGTEADNLALKGIAYTSKDRGNHIITSSIEHHAVMETCDFLKEQGFRITCVPVDKYGLINPEDVKKAITDKTILISIMHANNEVGTIQPIAEIGKLAREADILFHTDAVQTVGHIPVDVNEIRADLLSTSAHKLYGPKGVGALYVRKGTKITSLLHGGEQENRRRAGTHNTPAIVGFGKAAELAQKELQHESKHLTSLRNKLINGLQKQVEHIYLNGHPTKRLPNNANIRVDFVEGEAMLLSLDLEGIAISTGSACSSSNLKPSHILTAIGLQPDQAHSSLRLSLGRETTEEDIGRVLEVLPQIIARLRAMSPLTKSSMQEKTNA